MTAQVEAAGHVLPVSATQDAIVVARREAADGIAHLTLRPAVGGSFPAWEAGAHIDLHVPGHTRQYSICSSPTDRSSLEIAVLHDPDSRGGSAWVHAELTVGTRVVVGGPRNNFALAPSRKYLFIAGGIGITPMLAMIEAAEHAGKEWRLAYGGRSLRTMAFARELLDTYGPERILLYPAEETGRLDLETLLGVPRALMLVYACGPQRLLDAIEEYCLGWPAGALHLERFAAASDGQGTSGPFDVELSRTGRTVHVAADRTILDAVEEAGVRVLSSCRQGVCGTCEIPVLAGEIDHRDAILTPEDKARSASMMVCVSRAAAGCSRLTLDL
ncbi:ferredoxin [Tersicoccus solisilvae]|uniref:Ferredoxin n=1 Tax=Tersicoccus solisilvae TaxID=1882339 RepID=A0ABQ1NXE9_9MICC|nr:PDR/VanB family oxidoreductase [Tersicoccus solisilvae]GGC82429.1 ferredoxin [Tersicoccus solisilvae]